MLEITHRVAGDRRVGGNHAINALFGQHPGDGVDRGIIQIRGDLHQQGYGPAVGLRELLARYGQAPEKCGELVPPWSARNWLVLGEEMLTVM